MELCRLQTPNFDDRDAAKLKTATPGKLQVTDTPTKNYYKMPKIRRDEIERSSPYKEKVRRRKRNRFEEFERDPSKRNKRTKKRQCR